MVDHPSNLTNPGMPGFSYVPKQGTGTGFTVPPKTATGYAPFHALNYPNPRPFQEGKGTPIPNNTLGNTVLSFFNKVNDAGGSLIKRVIKSQLLTPNG